MPTPTLSRRIACLSAILAGVIASTETFAASPVDCAEKIPASLQLALLHYDLGFRIPRLADLDERSVGYDRENGGDGCYAVATGAFRRKGERDIALLLAPISGMVPRLVVATPRSRRWQVHSLPATYYCSSIALCYVEAGKPGRYDRTMAIPDPPSAPDERDSLNSRNPVIVSGTLESTGVAYAYLHRHWRYVWISD
jgi:hypothetical protein